MYQLSNKCLQIKIHKIGAELSSIVSLKNNKEYLWRGDANVWGGQAPILFPFVGRLKEDTFIENGITYHQKQHGFFRRSDAIKLIEKNDTKLIFSIQHSAETLEVYPYEFEFKTSYELIENKIKIEHTVINLGNKTMYFSIGEHPAFNCSLHNPNESYENCTLEFEYPETDVTWNISEEGLLDGTNREFLNQTKILNLNKSTFDRDALVFKKLTSNKVTLTNKAEGPLITVEFADFPFLGIWSKPNAPFVCIEPWQGYADSVYSSQKIEEKEAIRSLEAGKKHIATYSIETHS
jgi:galactose mutarotase-like enzyme